MARSFKDDYLRDLGKSGVLPTRPEFTNTGITHMYTGDTAPIGYLLCDGSAYDSVALPHLADLYAIIGNQFGGIDGTDFQVPDLRGMVVKGSGQNATRQKANGDYYNGGAISTYQADQIQKHYQQDNLNWQNSWNAGYPWRVYAYSYNGGTTYPHRVYGLAWVQEGGFQKSGGVYNPTSHPGYGSPRYGVETKPATISLNYIIKW